MTSKLITSRRGIIGAAAALADGAPGSRLPKLKNTTLTFCLKAAGALISFVPMLPPLKRPM